MIGQFLVNGLISGILYSLLAIGFALVYNTTKLFHIVAAAIYVFAAYMFYLFVGSYVQQIWLGGLIAMALTMVLSLLTDVLVYRPLKRRKANNNVALIASIGMMTVITNLLALFFGNETQVIHGAMRRVYEWGGLVVTTPQLWQLSIGAGAIVAFMLFIRLTPWGVRLRALSSDSLLFESLGYNTSHVRTMVFLLSGAFIALASCLTVFDIGLDPHMGMNVLVNALVAMIIGGMGRFDSCVWGGITLGLLQALTTYFSSSNWQNAVTFVLLLILLFLRPQGLVGEKQRAV